MNPSVSVQRTITALDSGSIHHISSGQVVVDLQTAVKELVENSLDAGATSIEVRFKEYGLESFEVIDNGGGIPPQDYDYIALKHHTSKLDSFNDLDSVSTFGFRGEALSSLCALAQSVSVTTATAAEAPVGTVINFEPTGKLKSKKGKVARQRGTTVTVSGIFKPLPVRRKELERNAKREYGKALSLLNAYALVPCANENHGVRLTVTNHTAQGKKSVQLRTDGTASTHASVSSIWGPKALENLIDLDLAFDVKVEVAVLRRLGLAPDDESANTVKVKGLISKFTVGCGRNGTDRQFFFVNGRPCAPSKVQKAFNEVYRSFNATQSPFIIADFVLPTNSCDINVSPDKRTILLHSENNLIQALRVALEEKYAPSRSTFDVQPSQILKPEKERQPLFLSDEPPATPSTSQSSVEGFAFGGPVLLSRDEEEGERDAHTAEVEEHASQSPTVTPMVDTEHCSQEVDPPEEDGTDAPTVSQIPLARLIAERRTAAVCDEDEVQLPIPTLRPPARLVARAPEWMRAKSGGSGVGWDGGEQLVLSTAGASWALRKRESEQDSADRPKKRSRADASEGREAQKGLRAMLSQFAREGTCVEEAEVDESESGGGVDGMEVDEEDSAGGAKSKALEAGEEEVLEDTMQMRHTAVDEEDRVDDDLPEVINVRMEDDDGLLPAAPSKDSSSVSATSEEIVRTGGHEIITASLNLSALTETWKQLRQRLGDALRVREVKERERDNKAKLDGSAGVANGDDDEAAEALSRVIDKPDFASMEIVGQFNLGFIVIRRRKPSGAEVEMDDLFIVDQHAADEKYNFENLQQTTRIKSQQLISPEVLELSAADELLALENIDVLRQNGFELDIAEDRPPGQRVLMTAHPVSGSTTFNAKDLEELLNLMQERPAGQIVRCSKARAMLAMRACRKSIMIGTALTKQQMTSVVQHMGTMDQPWHCPHGRPTMRHLSDIVGVGWDLWKGPQKVDWINFGDAAA